MKTEVRRNDAESRYELFDDGEMVGIADYRIDGSTVVMPHTEIQPRRRGHGLGAILVKAALADIRAADRTVVPSCWYVREYLDEHPEEADLVAS